VGGAAKQTAREECRGDCGGGRGVAVKVYKRFQRCLRRDHNMKRVDEPLL
jgi:hypothetical protein